ncbi:hypothetical protein F4820DRAFT_401063 [Hypoxylon rubiginosum]|uniref:Uncharacterized protein n=1 Tax=Hypoxylon rubiginosum TaxID=110542 RepID=A0ACB9ZH39_9PEZI|nr:hypothetical protein F4820DRAFT_401063 [Hypoxylon rubiginosum]
MSLSHLPFELLKEIFSHLDNQDERHHADNGYPTLCALALTCRRVSDVAVNTLYADIELMFNGRDAKDVERMILLNRSCRENPSIVDRILYSKIHCSFDDAAEAYNEFLDHLAKSTSLTTLKSEFYGKWTALQALYNYRERSFAQVRHLEIGLCNIAAKEWYLPAEQATRLCELPSLEILTTYAPIGGFGTESRPTATLAKLNHLHLFASRPVSAAVLESILPRTPNMKCLQLSVPGTATEVNREVAKYASMMGYDLDEPLCPAFYGELLAPVAASLKNLVIDTVNVKYPSHDGSRIDLSRFTNVTRLELSASLFFDTGKTTASCAWSHEIGKCLPPRIERLHLLLDGDQGVFWSLGDMRTHARSKTFEELWKQRLNTDHVDWLIHLLDRKRKDAASLKFIMIAEDPVADSDQNWRIVQWHMTDHLNTTASEAGVELAMKLRVPRLFESSEFEMYEDSWEWGADGTVSYEEENEAEELEYEIEE